MAIYSNYKHAVLNSIIVQLSPQYTGGAWAWIGAWLPLCIRRLSQWSLHSSEESSPEGRVPCCQNVVRAGTGCKNFFKRWIGICVCFVVRDIINRIICLFGMYNRVY